MKEHGSHSIERQDGILVIRAYDGWNVEASEALVQEILVFAKKFQGKPWAILVDLREWGLSTPESVAMGPEVIASLDRAGRTHTAMIVDEKTLARLIAESAFASQPRKSAIKFFERESAAREWFAECGFESEPPGRPASD